MNIDIKVLNKMSAKKKKKKNLTMYKKNCLPQPVSIYCQAGVLQPMGSQRVRHNLATEQQQPMQSCFNI